MGPDPVKNSPPCQVHLDGDGNLKIITGCLIGRHSRRPRTPAMSSFDVAVKLVVEAAANARKPI